MASLFVLQGPDQGKRFFLTRTPARIGREKSNLVNLSDQEVSRCHAELILAESGAYKILDLGSANGTFLNGQPVTNASLKPGDVIQVGSSILGYEPGQDLTTRVELLSAADPMNRSAIVSSVSARPEQLTPISKTMEEWQASRQAHLSVMYRATQAIGHIIDIDELLQQILQLVFESVQADRTAVLLMDESGTLQPQAVQWRSQPQAGEKLTISRTIVDHVHQSGQGVITTNAHDDSRFERSNSIVDFSIREALCVPVQGRHSTVGVLYADAQGDLKSLGPSSQSVQGQFTEEDLMLLVALGYQAGLAIENTRLYQAKIESERLAAMGQTVAVLSHHIKNILQGLKSGGYLIDQGLNQNDQNVIRRGWGIVEKNQTKVYDLVMDMLTFSKEREPCFEMAQINRTVSDVLELVQVRAKERGIQIDSCLAPDLPACRFDPEAIHRALLNLVNNGLEAIELPEGGILRISTTHELDRGVVRIVVTDNGPGIAPEERSSLFQPFASTKGIRGTGLGLPVTSKIVHEHSGSILVESIPGQGATFIVELPINGISPGPGHDDPDPSSLATMQLDSTLMATQRENEQ